MAKGGEPTEKKRHRKRDAWIGLLGIVFLYVGIQVLSRTDGVRSMVADKISNGTRLPVALQKCSVTPLLGLYLQGLDFYGVQMPDVRIKFNWFAWASTTTPLVRELEIRGMEVRFKQVPESGCWEPLVLHGMGVRLGSVLGLQPLSLCNGEGTLPKFPPHVINEKTLLQLRRAKVAWYDGQNRELAYVADIDTRIKLVAFSDRKAVQTLLKCGHIKLASGCLLSNLQLEAIQIDGYKPILILKMSDSAGEYEGFQTESLWQDLNLHIEALSTL